MYENKYFRSQGSKEYFVCKFFLLLCKIPIKFILLYKALTLEKFNALSTLFFEYNANVCVRVCVWVAIFSMHRKVEGQIQEVVTLHIEF